MKSTIVNAAKLKEFTSISDNIDCNLLEPYLQISQEMYISPILGEDLYSDIVDRYDNNTLTGDCYNTLYEDYLIPAIGYTAFYSAAPFIAYKMQRGGLLKHKTDNSETISVEEFTKYSERLENIKNFYMRRLEKYLCDNRSCFPNYNSPKNVRATGVGGIFTGFPKTRRNNDFWTTILDDCC